MTISCSRCDSEDVTMESSNEAQYPQTRIEFYVCNQCEKRFRQVLTA